ncbi:hypothetical protein [Acholeplasma granularum]|uniref:hypothetical protein n=1 Tax=Acholeplasma granularum TaxID=264635 RepID=UPI0004700CCC|nr:hypothetical protein [Acholeplasma granularum]
MIKIIDIHDDETSIALKNVRQAIDTIGKNILVIIHGYGSSTNSYKKLNEVRNIGRSRVKKGQISICISGPDLNDPINSAKFDYDELLQLRKFVVNSGVTILKK